jgi:iron(III) transport system ATP-binding protein
LHAKEVSVIRDGRDEAAVVASCRGVSKRFGSAQAVRSANLNLRDGELLALLGRSGCGKTTLLRLIAGLERADGGRIEINGRLVEGEGAHMPPEKRGVGVVFQDYALFPHLTVEKNVAFGLPRRERRGGAAAEMLDLVGLAGKARRRPHELSGGERQRVALARALAPRPAVVLLDEPFSSLDASLRGQMRAEVRRVLHEAGASAILVTHDQEEALSVADRVAVMLDGSVAQTGTPAEIYLRPATRGVASLLGDGNLLPGSAAAGDCVRCELGALRCAPGTEACVAEGKACEVFVRAEAIRLCGVDEGARGRVETTMYYGHDQAALVRMDSGYLIRVRLGAGEEVRVGQRVGLRVDGEVVAF